MLDKPTSKHFRSFHSVSRIFFALVFLIALASCGFFRSAERERCKRILPIEKFTEILLDLYLTEGFLVEQQSQLREPIDSVRYYFDGVLEKHQVSFETFNEALACYLLRHEEMESIHEEVLTRITIMQSELKAEEERIQRARHRPTGHIWAIPEPATTANDTIPPFSVLRLKPEDLSNN
ncbi:MAG TPA: DUF4296 domain-containing protein [Bacteroidales bacterium]|nr:DUF4296 domain-containing protein [Bacteroidales bacterium]